jgi:ABC-type proline/glycine betaine transport system ATPase subunit
MADMAARQALLDAQPEAALVAAALPLRANLSVLENIAIVPQYRQNLGYDAAADQAWALLSLLGRTDCAFKRDPDLDHAERFIAKLLRAVILTPPIILIDRPALLLPDIPYPPFLDDTLLRLEGRFAQCWIVDYQWNEPLYAPR